MRGYRLRAAAALAAMLVPVLSSAGQDSEPGFDETDEIVRYVFADGRITGAVVSTPEGTELRRETYIRDSRGAVVDIRLLFPDGRRGRVGGTGGLEWMEFPEGDRIHRTYLPDGRLETEERFRGSTRISRRDYRYRGESRTPALLEEARPEEGWKTVTEYGDRGQVLRETRTTDAGTEETSIYSRDDRDRPLEIRILSGRSERRIRYSYGENGAETEERTDTTGALVLRVVRNADGTSVEERFDGGTLFARTYLEGGRLVREEIYLEGRLVRVREAP